MRQRLFVLVSIAGLTLAAPAYAQDRGEFDDITDPEGEPETEPVATDPVATEPVATEPVATDPVETRAEAAEAGGADHDLVVGHWGAEVVTTLGIPGGLGFAPDSIPMLGLRKWTARDSGWEAGATLAFISDGGDPAQTTLWVGGSFGLLKALGVFDHMVVFWEPSASLLIIVPNDGVDGTDDESGLALDGRMSIGSEIQLGMIGLPMLALTTRLSAGLQVVSLGSTSFFIGTEGGIANSVQGLIDADIGFVMYW